jgi:hypothetical protein
VSRAPDSPGSSSLSRTVTSASSRRARAATAGSYSTISRTCPGPGCRPRADSSAPQGLLPPLVGIGADDDSHSALSIPHAFPCGSRPSCHRRPGTFCHVVTGAHNGVPTSLAYSSMSPPLLPWQPKAMPRRTQSLHDRRRPHCLCFASNYCIQHSDNAAGFPWKLDTVIGASASWIHSAARRGSGAPYADVGITSIMPTSGLCRR